MIKRKIVLIAFCSFALLALTTKNKKTCAPKKQSRVTTKAAGQVNKTEAPASPTATGKKADIPATITINNTMDTTTLGYKHFTGTYFPSSFIMTVDGKKIATHDDLGTTIYRTATITRPSNNIVTINYSFEFKAFGKTYRKAKRKLEFEIDPTQATVDLLFSWKAKEHVQLKPGTLLNATEETA